MIHPVGSICLEFTLSTRQRTTITQAHSLHVPTWRILTTMSSRFNRKWVIQNHFYLRFQNLDEEHKNKYKTRDIYINVCNEVCNWIMELNCQSTDLLGVLPLPLFPWPWLARGLHDCVASWSIGEDSDSIDIARKDQCTHGLWYGKEREILLMSYGNKWPTLILLPASRYFFTAPASALIGSQITQFLVNRTILWHVVCIRGERKEHRANENRMMPVHNVSYVSHISIARVILLSTESRCEYPSQLLHRPQHDKIEEQ